MSKNPDTSFATIKLNDILSNKEQQVTSLKAWKHIQESSPEMKRAMSQIQAGTKPSKKEKKIMSLKKMISEGSISKEGLLVFKIQLPMELKKTEQIVVPKEYSLSILTLIHNNERFQHPSAHQLEQIVKRRFHIFNRAKLCKEVVDNCIQCQAHKNIS